MYFKNCQKCFTKLRLSREEKWNQLLQEGCLYGEIFLLQLRGLYDGPNTHHFRFSLNKNHPNIFKFIFCMMVSFRAN